MQMTKLKKVRRNLSKKSIILTFLLDFSLEEIWGNFFHGEKFLNFFFQMEFKEAPLFLIKNYSVFLSVWIYKRFQEFKYLIIEINQTSTLRIYKESDNSGA